MVKVIRPLSTLAEFPQELAEPPHGAVEAVRRHASVPQNQSTTLGPLETACGERNAGNLRVVQAPGEQLVIDPGRKSQDQMQSGFRADDLDPVVKLPLERCDQ